MNEQTVSITLVGSAHPEACVCELCKMQRQPSPTVREAAKKAAANVAKEIDNLRQTYGAVSFAGNCFDEIIANAFRDFVPRDEFEKLRDEFWLEANQDGCAKWAGDKLDAILRRKP
jgi:hypothetical protein